MASEPDRRLTTSLESLEAKQSKLGCAGRVIVQRGENEISESDSDPAKADLSSANPETMIPGWRSVYSQALTTTRTMLPISAACGSSETPCFICGGK